MSFEKIHLLSRLDSVSARFVLNTMDKADPRGLQHAFCVAEISHTLGQIIDDKECSLEDLWLAGLMHDIGLLGVPKEITDGKGKLNRFQRKYIEHHPKLSKFMIDHLFTSPRISHAVLCHHERIDGKGYPNRIAGDAIPLMARIISVADAYDSMRNAAWILKKRSHDNAVAELENCAGSQFDSTIVKQFHLHHDPIFVAYEKAQSLSIKAVLRRI